LGFLFQQTGRSDVVELQICDGIGYSNDGHAEASFGEFGAKLAFLDPHVKELDVRINSMGGHHHIAIGIHDLLVGSRFRVVSTIEGMAFSCGAIVSQGAAWRRMAADGVFMMHRAVLTADLQMFPDGFFRSSAADLRKYADWLDAASEEAVRIFMRRTGRGASDIRELYDSFLNAEEAKAAGLVDEIVEARPLPVVRHWQTTHVAPQVSAALARRVAAAAV
jgi:ATP-dependent protease ClpP protease subunit